MGKKTIILLFLVIITILLLKAIAFEKSDLSGPAAETSGRLVDRAAESLPAGFEGIRFSGQKIYDPEEPFFCLEEEEEETHVRYIYVPVDMKGTIYIHMKSGLTLTVNGTDDYESGSLLPAFNEDCSYHFKLTDSRKEKVDSAEVVFLYTSHVSSMYVTADEEAIREVVGDKKHNTTAPASFCVCTEDGTLDSSGECSIRGHGNSTWSQKKKPFNLNLKQQQSILGMEPCRKFALISNYWDSTQMRQMIAYKTAASIDMPFTAETAYVNLFLNGHFQGLYLLSQRLNVDGGTVRITDLDEQNQNANRNVRSKEIQKSIQETDEKNHEAAAYLWPRNPADISGGYLLEMDNRYYHEDSWFQTETRHIVIKAPEMPSVEEYNYISSYVREAERALLSEDGIHPETGRSCFTYFDLDSWARMYLIQDFFIQADDEFYSFFFYKKNNDPLLYCGPVWDFDQCLGTLNNGTYYKTLAHTMWLRDSRKRWLNRMDQLPEFRERVRTIFLEEFEPVVRAFLQEEYDRTAAWLEKDARLNYRRWNKTHDFMERTGLVKTLMQERVDFYHDYYCNTEQYHRLLFQFEWGDLSYYIRDGDSPGFIPTAEYEECQSSSQIKRNGLITGWRTADGLTLHADTPVHRDLDLLPEYEQK